ncbi:hypothetical protein fugu_019407 [Takifugu bimaculatus]|uniref:Secreted phosphoprotein 1 n=1 Tax=Takifugu bimaculatus TaxID=433685 RepID=A0A4Z2BJE0_9TELE|nr:hypothetical protein fugu_019407 [Takifugu bimaculatus]
MRVALVFLLLFATVFCRPARKVSDSSESAEEVKRRPAVSGSINSAKPLQNVAAADESTETEEDEVVAQAPEEAKSDMTDTFSSAAPSVDSNGSEGSDEDDDESEDEDDSDSSDSDEPSTPAPTTASPEVFTEEPVAETTQEPILPTIVTDNGRGDSMGGYPDDYKSILYIEDKSYHKVSGPYKPYEYVDAEKKTSYDMNHGNEVEKSMQVYKVQTLQVQSDLLEEDTSTPEMDNQGMDISSSISQDQGPLPEEGDSASNNESGSSSNPDEEENEASSSSVSDSSSSSHNSEPEESSEESTADSTSDESNSTQSDSDEDGAGLDKTTDVPALLTAK